MSQILRMSIQRGNDKRGEGAEGEKRKMLVIVLSYNGVIVCGVIKDMCSLFS